MQTDPYLSPCTKFKSKWIKELNITLITLNLIEERVGSSLECIVTGDHFVNTTPIAQTLRLTTNKWDLMKPKASVRPSEPSVYPGADHSRVATLQLKGKAEKAHQCCYTADRCMAS
ncbi:hypothetical protein STEG23_009864 [Scotinomys teguina]